MEQLTARPLIAHAVAISTRKKPVLHGGKSITQPDMALGIATILERSRRGMEIQGYNPIYYGNKNIELTGFENLSEIEKIEFVRRFKKAAEDQVIEFKKIQDEARKAEAIAAREKEIEKAVQAASVAKTEIK